MKLKVSEIVEFSAYFTSEAGPDYSIFRVIEDITHLITLSGDHSGLEMKASSVGLTDKEEARRNTTEARIAAICESYGIVPIFSNDQKRGTVELKVPSGRTIIVRGG